MVFLENLSFSDGISCVFLDLKGSHFATLKWWDLMVMNQTYWYFLRTKIHLIKNKTQSKIWVSYYALVLNTHLVASLCSSFSRKEMMIQAVRLSSSQFA